MISEIKNGDEISSPVYFNYVQYGDKYLRNELRAA